MLTKSSIRTFVRCAPSLIALPGRLKSKQKKKDCKKPLGHLVWIRIHPSTPSDAFFLKLDRKKKGFHPNDTFLWRLHYMAQKASCSPFGWLCLYFCVLLQLSTVIVQTCSVAHVCTFFFLLPVVCGVKLCGYWMYVWAPTYTFAGRSKNNK